MSSVVGVSRRDAYHFNNLGVYVFGDNTALCCDVLEHLMQRLCLDLLALQLRVRVVEVEDYGTLMQFLDEQLWTFVWRCLCAYPIRAAHSNGVCTTYP